MIDWFLQTLRRGTRDERGLALPLALGVTVVLSSLSAGIFTYVTTNQGAAERARADQKAYGLAEAGLSYAFSILGNAGTAVPPYGSGSVPSTPTAASPSGTEYWGTLSGNTWTLYGRGTVTNPSGHAAAAVIRTVSAQAEIVTTTTGDTRPYDYFFVDQPSGCFTLENTVTLEVALYVRGDLCLENNTLLSGPKVHVLGNVHVNSPQASVGTSAAPIPDFSITGNCYRNGSLTACDASATSRVWAAVYGTSPPVLTKPTVDMAETYANADLGPQSPCTTLTGSGFPGFDNDGVMNASMGDTVLTPSTSYDCYVGSLPNPTARIKWVPGSNPSQWGTLTIKGTIFFDGNLTWGNLTKIHYDGLGSIYGSGILVFQNQTKICAVTTCDEHWVPADDFLTFVVGSLTTVGSLEPTSGDIGQNATFQGAMYLVNDYEQDNNTTFWGPVIARNAAVANGGLFKPIPGGLEDLPPGTPMDTITLTLLQTVPGSYSG